MLEFYKKKLILIHWKMRIAVAIHIFQGIKIRIFKKFLRKLEVYLRRIGFMFLSAPKNAISITPELRGAVNIRLNHNNIICAISETRILQMTYYLSFSCCTLFVGISNCIIIWKCPLYWYWYLSSTKMLVRHSKMCFLLSSFFLVNPLTVKLSNLILTL